MVDRGASGHCFEYVLIRDLKHRLQDNVYLTTPCKIFTAGESMLEGTAEDVVQSLIPDDNGNPILVRVESCLATPINQLG